MTSETAAAFSLLSAAAVRTRARRMLMFGIDGKLPNFTVDLSRLDATADRVIAVTRGGAALRGRVATHLQRRSG